MLNEEKVNQLSEEVVDVFIKEVYPHKPTLLPKVRSIISGFALTSLVMDASAKERTRLIKRGDRESREKNFWKKELKVLVGEEKMKEYYTKLEAITGK